MLRGQSASFGGGDGDRRRLRPALYQQRLREGGAGRQCRAHRLDERNERAIVSQACETHFQTVIVRHGERIDREDLQLPVDAPHTDAAAIAGLRDPAAEEGGEISGARERGRLGGGREEGQFLPRAFVIVGIGEGDRESDRRTLVERGERGGRILAADAAVGRQGHGHRHPCRLLDDHLFELLLVRIPDAAGRLVSLEDRVPADRDVVGHLAALAVEIAAQEEHGVGAVAAVELVGRRGTDRVLPGCAHAGERRTGAHEPIGEDLEGVVVPFAPHQVGSLPVEAA